MQYHLDIHVIFGQTYRSDVKLKLKQWLIPSKTNIGSASGIKIFEMEIPVASRGVLRIGKLWIGNAKCVQLLVAI